MATPGVHRRRSPRVDSTTLRVADAFRTRTPSAESSMSAPRKESTWWIIGRTDDPEFSLGPLVDQPCLYFDDLKIVLSHFSPGVSESDLPRGIMIWLDRPARFPPHEIETLADLLPLTCILTVVGSWCDGELRTGFPARGIMRYRWSSWKIMELDNIEGLCTGASPALRTLSPVERFLNQPITLGSTRDHSSRGPLAIVTPWRETFEALSSVVEMAGFEAVWIGSADQAKTSHPWVAVLIDEDGRPSETTDLSLNRNLPRLRLVNFPRGKKPDGGELGETIVAKPFELNELERWLEQVGKSQVGS